MKILVLADEEEKSLWDYYHPERVKGVDLILSCGDLDPDYLEFLVTMTGAELLYVRGNHDGIYDEKPPQGCICIDDRIWDFRGLRIVGLGGSMKYSGGPGQFTEAQMRARIRRLYPQILIRNGFDILLTHAPAAGWGDLEDLPHRGFACFNELMEEFRPAYMLHGHVHRAYGRVPREHRHTAGTHIINACGSVLIEPDRSAYPPEGKTGSPLYDLYISLKNRRS